MGAAGDESHAGQVFCCVAALAIADELDLLDRDLLCWWCGAALAFASFVRLCGPRHPGSTLRSCLTRFFTHALLRQCCHICS